MWPFSPRHVHLCCTGTFGFDAMFACRVSINSQIFPVLFALQGEFLKGRAELATTR